MANKKQLAMLKRSVDKWNAWREKNPEVEVDLSGADLSDAELTGADLAGADLFDAELTGADLADADLFGADLTLADLTDADLTDADLGGADLSEANLRGAFLTHAGLKSAILPFALFDDTDLEGADITDAYLGGTIFANIDLSAVKGLETLIHAGPSTIGADTIYASKGEIPEEFLRGCGVPDTFITFNQSLMGKAIEYYSFFISYSSKDEDFVKRLYADLQSNGVRCWFAPEDLKTGDKFRTRIDEAIRHYDKLLLVLSENSIRSAWVEKEVETAFERERRDNCTVLFPVRLDKTVMDADQAWAADIRRIADVAMSATRVISAISQTGSSTTVTSRRSIG